MKKIKVKELLQLEPGKCYALKYKPACITMDALELFHRECAEKNITIIFLATENLDQVKFETKKGN